MKIVVVAKHRTHRNMMIVPTGPRSIEKAFAVSVTPSAASLCQFPATRIIRAVAVHIIKVSTIGPTTVSYTHLTLPTKRIV